MEIFIHAVLCPCVPSISCLVSGNPVQKVSLFNKTWSENQEMGYFHVKTELLYSKSIDLLICCKSCISGCLVEWEFTPMPLWNRDTSAQFPRQRSVRFRSPISLGLVTSINRSPCKSKWNCKKVVRFELQWFEPFHCRQWGCDLPCDLTVQKSHQREPGLSLAQFVGHVRPSYKILSSL